MEGTGGEKELGNDMPEAQRQDAELYFRDALAHCDGEDAIAGEIRNCFEKKYSGAWHCVVGRSFSSAVTFQRKTHFAKRMGPFVVELWKSG
jgi:hypothetical protein